MTVNEILTNDTIEIPVPPQDQEVVVLEADAPVEIDEIPQRVGHFSVDHRRC